MSTETSLQWGETSIVLKQGEDYEVVEPGDPTADFGDDERAFRLNESGWAKVREFTMLAASQLFGVPAEKRGEA